MRAAALHTRAPPAPPACAAAAGEEAASAASLSQSESVALRAAFVRDGVLPCCRILSADEAAAAYAAFLRYEAACGRVTGDARFKAHLMLPWLWRLVHHPRLAATVAAALGAQHVACWSTGALPCRCPIRAGGSSYARCCDCDG